MAGAPSTLDRVLQTCVEMVVDRGYAVDRASVDMDPAIVATRGDDVLHVRFLTSEDKIGVKVVRQLQAGLGDVTRLLLVSNEGPTPFTRKEVAEDERIEFWTFGKLVLNVTKFAIVPPHALVPPDDAARLAREYHVTSADEWPKLPRHDPICRYYDFPAGRLVKIDRAFGNGAHVYYRLVV